MSKIQENDVVRDLTAEEESQLTKDNAISVEKQTARINEATAKATAQASGNTKLLDLGLSQEEATSLTGYTPK